MDSLGDAAEKCRGFVPRFWLVCVCMALCFFFASCATKPVQEAPSALDYFSWFLPEAGASFDSNDLYAVVPVAGNEDLLQSILSKSMPKKSAADLIKRTKTVYLGVSFTTPGFKLVAEGNFPKSFKSFIFTSSAGWKKVSFKTEKKLPSDFSSYYQAHTGTNYLLQASLPVSGLVFSSSGGMEDMLTLAGTQTEPLSAADDIRQVLEGAQKTSICFFVPGARSLIPRFLGGDITLPVTYVSGTCTPVLTGPAAGSYSADVTLQFTDSRFVRPSAAVVRNALKVFPGAVVTIVNDLTIHITDLQINPGVIAGIL